MSKRVKPVSLKLSLARPPRNTRFERMKTLATRIEAGTDDGMSDKELQLVEEVEFFLLLSQHISIDRAKLGLQALLEWKVKPRFYHIQGFKRFFGANAEYSKKLLEEMNRLYWKVFPVYYKVTHDE